MEKLFIEMHNKILIKFSFQFPVEEIEKTREISKENNSKK